MELKVNEPLIARYYLLAKENNIDLKYLCVPEIVISDDYLKTLPYEDYLRTFPYDKYYYKPYFAEDEKLDLNNVSLEKLCEMSYKYHTYRTNVRKARSTVEREQRNEERDNDPLYWLYLYMESQTQLKMWLGKYYKKNGVKKIEDMETINKYLKTMEDALVGFKRAADKIGHISYKEFPTIINVKYPKVVEHDEKSLETENKYRKFCEKYGIDLSLIASKVKLFTPDGLEHDEKLLQKYIKLLFAKKEWLEKQLKKYEYGSKEYEKWWRYFKSYSEWLRDENETKREVNFDEVVSFKERSLVYEDYPFTLYRRFINASSKLRNTIGRYLSAGLTGELTPNQLENLNSAIELAELCYRELIMSTKYVAGFAVSGRKEIEQVNYRSNEVEITQSKNTDETTIAEEQKGLEGTNEVLSKTTEEVETPVTESKITTEDILLDLYKQAQELLSDIENAKREKYLIEGRRRQIAELREKLEQEEKQLFASEQDIVTQISHLEQKHSDLTEEIQRKK